MTSELPHPFRRFKDLPSALKEGERIFQKLANNKPAIFLDYDGTLSPIAKRPEDALLSEEMKTVLEKLAKFCPVAIVSGRDRVDVTNMVGLNDLYYAGSHGFDITGPQNLIMQHEGGKECLPYLEAAERELRIALENMPGAYVERKKFSIGIHYRNVPEENIPFIKDTAQRVLQNFPKLKKGVGKKIIELKPNIDWHKGKAIFWLLERLDLSRSEVLPIYIGDDITDEDAFRALVNNGLGILVGDHGQPTNAHYRLENVNEVKQFLNGIITLLEKPTHESQINH